MQRPRDLARKLIASSLFVASAWLILSVGLWKQTAQPSFKGEGENGTSTNHSSLSAIKLDEATRAELVRNYARQPLSFETNQGQTDSQVQFIARGPGYALLLTPSEAALELRSAECGLRNERNEKPCDNRAGDPRPLKNPQSAIRNPQSSALRMKLVGANSDSIARGRDELPGKRNYFLGDDPSRWRSDVPVFARVEYDEIYSGVNLVYYGNHRQLEYDFVVSPHSDPAQIKLNFGGARSVRIDESGDLVLQTASGEIRQHKPVVYQETEGTRHEIAGRYTLLSTPDSRLKTPGSFTVGFQIGDYDRSLPLVIDPVLVYSTYLGGASDDFGSSVAVDSAGNVYVAGVTNSVNFPVRTPYQSANGGTSDIFVTKLDSTGTNVIYSTYVGGSLNDRGDGIAVDSSGNAYVVGRTDSLNFPTTQGALASTYRGGDFDAVVLKLNPQGNGLVYSTYLGGSDNDSAIGIAVDPSGNAYVTGGTKSSDFPTTASAYLSSHTSDTDAYLTKLNSTGSALLYSSYLGGSATDRGSGVAVDSIGNAYVIGYTSSADFPTQNPFQPSLAGSFDAFVAKFDTTTSGSASLAYCSYLGGAADDKGYGIALDSGGNAYVTGQTASNNFPLSNALQQTFGGVFDAFVAKISPAGAKLYATYLGGSGDDRGIGIAVSSSGNVYVTGFTSSTNFPTANPLQASNGGGSDAFIAKLNSSGNALVYSTYLGGSGNENLSGNVTWSGSIALDSSSNAYITGFTSSTNFPSANPFQGVNGGGIDAFVAKVVDTSNPADYTLAASPSTQTVAPGSSVNYTATITPSGGFTGNVSLSASGLPTGASASFSPTPVNITDASAKSSTMTVTTSAATPVGTYPLTITSTSGSLQHTTTVSLRVVSSGSADISITQTASPNPADIGTSISYRIIVTNSGPASATNVNVKDTLPANVTSVSSNATQGSCSGTGPVICGLGTIASGASAIVTINATPNSQGQATNTANVTANEPDPDTSNNSSSVNTLVEAPAVPTILDQNLSVKTILTGLDQPTSMAFIGPNEFFVLEKATGKVQHVFNGQLQTVAVDLAVNNASERGLLGIALHPNFPATPYVYLYWTESSTGSDTGDIDQVPLLGNRVDRFTWNGSTLTLDRNIIKLRALQQDAGQPSRGNHNGGVLRFGPDGKLYIVIGDNGRRGYLQNVTNGTVPDDQFGGPEPDDAHLTGVILRLNDDGTTPADNPFFNATTPLTGQAAANIKKVFAYGIRNSFGMVFDPATGNLWTEENGDDAFDEINRVVPGFNGGWVQIMGPSSRISDYKSIETTYGNGTLQQIRWSPTLIADTPAQALSRLYNLPGSQYREPEFSWKYAVAPSTIGFVNGSGLGAQFNGDLFVGASRTTLFNGYLFHFKFSGDRLSIATTDPRLQDKVADNLDKFDITESETLLIGKNFGITTDIETGPDGNLYVVSLSNGAIYQIFANNTVQLGSQTYTVGEAAGSLAVNVTRTGNTAGAITVDYATSDAAGLTPCNQANTGVASSRCDYVTTVGTLRFAAGETSKTIFIPIVNDSYAEGAESFTITLSNPNGATLGSVSTATVTITDNDATTGGNPIVDPQFFIRQQYIDFLGREPDPPGFAGWLSILNNCPPSGKDAQGNFCDRIEISADFFRSPEFQSRGYFIYRFYSVGFGRTPLYREFTPDFAKVSGFLTDAQLEANKVAFVREFMARTEFRNRYDALTDPAAYVNALVSTAGVTLSNKQQLVDDLIAGRKTRAEVLRAIVESTEVYQKFYNEAFVVMQYFGYLRRDPDILYLDWIKTMNTNGGDYRVMINGFMNSSEYFLRFGP